MSKPQSLTPEERTAKAADLIAKGYGDEDLAHEIFKSTDPFALSAAKELRHKIQAQSGGR